MSHMIIRVKPSKAVARILSNPDAEDPEDSPMEFLDQRIETGQSTNVSYEIPDEATEKDLSNQKSHDILKEHTAQKQFAHHFAVVKGETNNHGQSNDSGFERH